MLKRSGARNISCSVIESHRMRNGFSTSRGFSVWLTHIPIVRSRSSIIGPSGCATHPSREQRCAKASTPPLLAESDW